MKAYYFLVLKRGIRVFHSWTPFVPVKPLRGDDLNFLHVLAERAFWLAPDLRRFQKERAGAARVRPLKR